jgi:hypothetical protein
MLFVGRWGLVCFENRFLWQEGHTAHATKVAVEESEKMMNVYADFLKLYGIPVVKVLKPKRSVLLVQRKHIVSKH